MKAILLFNASGETMIQKKFNNAIEEIDIHHLAGGLYLIRIATEDESVMNKLIVE